MKKILLLSLMSFLLISCGSDSDSSGGGNNNDQNERDIWGIQKQPDTQLDMTSLYGTWENAYTTDNGQSITTRVAIAGNPDRILVSSRCQRPGQVDQTVSVRSDIIIRKIDNLQGDIEFPANLTDTSQAGCQLQIQKGIYAYFISLEYKDVLIDDGRSFHSYFKKIAN